MSKENRHYPEPEREINELYSTIYDAVYYQEYAEINFRNRNLYINFQQDGTVSLYCGLNREVPDFIDKPRYLARYLKNKDISLNPADFAATALSYNDNYPPVDNLDWFPVNAIYDRRTNSSYLYWEINTQELNDYQSTPSLLFAALTQMASGAEELDRQPVSKSRSKKRDRKLSLPVGLALSGTMIFGTIFGLSSQINPDKKSMSLSDIPASTLVIDPPEPILDIPSEVFDIADTPEPVNTIKSSQQSLNHVYTEPVTGCQFVGLNPDGHVLSISAVFAEPHQILTHMPNPTFHLHEEGQWWGADLVGYSQNPFNGEAIVTYSKHHDPAGGGTGLVIEGTGSCEGWFTSWFHLLSLSEYQVGQKIPSGTILGFPGCSGIDSTKPNERIRCDKNYVYNNKNPIGELKDGIVIFPPLNHTSVFYCGPYDLGVDLRYRLDVSFAGHDCQFVDPNSIDPNPLPD